MSKKKADSSAKPSSTPSNQDGGHEDSVGFEEALKQVERIVAELEAGDLGLTESLGRYEIGVKRLKQCHRLLGEAEQRVSVLAGFDADGNPVTESMSEIEVRGGGGRQKPSSTKKRRTRKSIAVDEGNEDALSDGEDGETVDDSRGLF